MTRQRITRLMLPFAALIIFTIPHANAAGWPLFPDSAAHEIVANYGMFLHNPGYPPFLHGGIDMPAEFYTPVYAVESGWVKTITTRFDHYSYWRIAISASDGSEECDAWVYAHLVPGTFPFGPGEWVNEGDTIGLIVDWPYHDNTDPHLHLSICRYAGTPEEWADGVEDWEYSENPLDFLPIDNDSIAPVIGNARTGYLLGFCRNETTDYFDPETAVSGDVDIIASAIDYHNKPDWGVVPYSVEYRIDGDSSIPWTMAACFTGSLGVFDFSEYAVSIYKSDNVCSSYVVLDPPAYKFCFTLTNSNGDTLLDPSESGLSWETGYFHNGDYNIHVRTADKSGNTDEDSMMVTVENFFELTGTVDISDGKPFTGIVTVASTEAVDTCDGAGEFAFTGVPGGSQQITAVRLGYMAKDTVVMMNEAKHIDFVLDPCPYLRGDPNDDGNLNVGDAVFIINHVFKGGDPPDPPTAGDANCDDALNVGDAVFMINYVFKGGVAPCPDCL